MGLSRFNENCRKIQVKDRERDRWRKRQSQQDIGAMNVVGSLIRSWRSNRSKVRYVTCGSPEEVNSIRSDVVPTLIVTGKIICGKNDEAVACLGLSHVVISGRGKIICGKNDEAVACLGLSHVVISG
ncbi:hypothetical protein L6452_13131 [Arctium lappa]|uniref:Uncharacterized protein n=1 Tax=Arctium lappa TaxID=4217 RepID=A0ACB9CHB3_ARCLA|nr:hypothetical protein L6452_13131 [Arctium lappa]